MQPLSKYYKYYLEGKDFHVGETNMGRLDFEPTTPFLVKQELKANQWIVFKRSGSVAYSRPNNLVTYGSSVSCKGSFQASQLMRL